MLSQQYRLFSPRLKKPSTMTSQNIIVLTRVGPAGLLPEEFFTSQILAADLGVSVAVLVESAATERYARRKGIIVDFPSC